MIVNTRGEWMEWVKSKLVSRISSSQPKSLNPILTQTTLHGQNIIEREREGHATTLPFFSTTSLSLYSLSLNHPQIRRFSLCLLIYLAIKEASPSPSGHPHISTMYQKIDYLQYMLLQQHGQRHINYFIYDLSSCGS